MIKLEQLKTDIQENATMIKEMKKTLRNDHRTIAGVSTIQWKLDEYRKLSRAQHLVYAWLHGKRMDQAESMTKFNDHFWNADAYFIYYKAKAILGDEDALKLFKQWMKDTSTPSQTDFYTADTKAA